MQSTQYQNICFVSLGSFAKSVTGNSWSLSITHWSEYEWYAKIPEWLTFPAKSKGAIPYGPQTEWTFPANLNQPVLVSLFTDDAKTLLWFPDILRHYHCIDSIKVLPHWLLVWNKWTKRMIQSVKTTGTVSGKRMCSIITNCFDIAASLTIWLVSKGSQADGELGSHINNRTRSELMLRHNRWTIIGRSW